MSKDLVRSVLDAPFRLIDILMGVKKAQIEEGVNMFRLGKMCPQCRRTIIHRQAVSVCQCYCFVHKDCLKNQLRDMNLSHYSVVECKSCKSHLKLKLDIDYYLKINIALKDIIVLLICTVICALSMVYLINFKNSQKEEIFKQDSKTHQKQCLPFITIQEVLSIALMFTFGALFWLSLFGMIISKKTRIKEIGDTNIEIKVSAFEEIQGKIRQESQQQIFFKKEETDI